MTRDGGFKQRLRRLARERGIPYTKVLADRRLADQQRTYYEHRAPLYGDQSTKDRRGGGMMPPDVLAAIVEELAPSGHVLELACGPGGFTEELLARARSVTAVDASPTMLERNRRAVGDPSVTYIEADIFEWRPTRTYDVVFFAFWISHVPPTQFDAFWQLVRSCLAPGGRVAFVDEDDRATGHDDVRIVDGTPIATRTLSDGRRYDIVKVFWEPSRLEARLREVGWDIAVSRAGDTYLVGHGTPATP